VTIGLPSLAWYDGGMKEKTSITLSRDLLAGIDRLAGPQGSRSAFIERVLRRYLREQVRAQAHARDLERINEGAERLNSEAADALDYQAASED
jgi:metal-responsive CopG/Arc/MetJ family transcriptional regulator